MSDDDDMFTGEFTTNVCKNFKIPRKGDSMNNRKKAVIDDIILRGNPPPPGTTDFPAQPNEYISPLATVYAGAGNIYPGGQPYYPVNHNQTNIFENQALPPPPPPPPPEKPSINGTAIATACVSDAVQMPRPGTKRRNSIYTLPTTDGIPAELKKLILPLCCELCSTKLNSPISAKMHYESKNHEKKVNAWLGEWSERTGEPIPKRTSSKKGPIGPNAFHCDVCDLPLTSLQHANQHYMGRKHRQVLAGRGKPRGDGYYDANYKWVRTGKPEIDPTNRFFIGQAFLQESDGSETLDQTSETVTVSMETSNTTPPGSPLFTNCLDDAIVAQTTNNDDAVTNVDTPPAANNKQQSNAKQPPNLDPNKYCEICNISVTSEIHMKLHLNGQKHAKKLRLLGAPPHADKDDTVSQSLMSPPPPSTQPILAGSKNKNKSSDDGYADAMSTAAYANQKCDYSVYRTPSGQYYCQVCDITVVSEVLLSQHFNSKKHYRNVASSKKK